MEALKIHVVIGGRTYPIRISNASEEEGIRRAAARINELLQQYESSYAVNDKQDVLAMCALQFASQMEIKDLVVQQDNDRIQQEIEQISKRLDLFLK